MNPNVHRLLKSLPSTEERIQFLISKGKSERDAVDIVLNWEGCLPKYKKKESVQPFGQTETFKNLAARVEELKRKRRSEQAEVSPNRGALPEPIDPSG